MYACKEDERHNSADQDEKHVPLRIPDVPLRPQKRFAHVSCDEERRPPLDELPECADGETNVRDNEREPAASLQRCFSEQHFSNDDRGEQSQRKVPDAIVVIARRVEQRFHPVSERGLGVSIVAAVVQDKHV